MKKLLVLLLLLTLVLMIFFSLKNRDEKVVSDQNLLTAKENGITMDYPDTWNLQYSKEVRPFSAKLRSLFFISKQKQPTSGDIPTKDLSHISVRSYITDQSLKEIHSNFYEETNQDFQTGDKTITEFTKFNGYDSVLIYNSIDEITPTKAPYPTVILIKPYPDQLFYISTQFFDSKEDIEYTNMINEEINLILSSIKVGE